VFPGLEIPAAGITIAHVDTLIVHTGSGKVRDAARDPEPTRPRAVVFQG
jgi:hypothetical protein